MNKYNIYVVNQMTSSQTFWCFLAAPEVSLSGSVYANSSAYVTVEPNAPGSNIFTIPVQYEFQAGASNQAVGPNIEINSSTSNNVNLGDQWLATYYDPALHQGPDLAIQGSLAPSGTMQYLTNNYDQSQEAPDGWYASETFGIQTAAGFIGVTWAPEAGHTMTITPKLQFYIATGSFSANTLADMTDVSTSSQTVNLTDFDAALNCTVTLDASGNWSAAPGKPAPGRDIELEALIESHLLLARAHERLVTTSIGADVAELPSLAVLER